MSDLSDKAVSDLQKENKKMRDALINIEFFASQFLSSSGLNDPKHTMLTVCKLIHEEVKKCL